MSSDGVAKEPGHQSASKPTSKLDITSILAAVQAVKAHKESLIEQKTKSLQYKQELEERTRKGERDDRDYYNCVEGEVVGNPGMEYRISGRLGTGVYSHVYKAYRDESGGRKECAIKLIRKHQLMEQGAKKEIELYKDMAREGPACDLFGSQFIMTLRNDDNFKHQGI